MDNYGNDMKVLRTGSYYPVTEAKALNGSKQHKMYLAAKRMLDILGSAAGIFLLSPIFLLVMALLKLESRKNDVFFRQIRIGKNGLPFEMYKFRSMVVNAEQILENLLEHNEIAGAMFKMKDDPRITKVGRFIRKTSLDELPQLWNVFKGEMSLVGPRPSLPREVEQYTSYDMQRLGVIPGCTGLWQVSGRNSLSFQEMVDLDLHYIRNRNIWFDIKLILKTIKVMVIPKDAY